MGWLQGPRAPPAKAPVFFMVWAARRFGPGRKGLLSWGDGAWKEGEGAQACGLGAFPGNPRHRLVLVRESLLGGESHRSRILLQAVSRFAGRGLPFQIAGSSYFFASPRPPPGASFWADQFVFPSFLRRSVQGHFVGRFPNCWHDFSGQLGQAFDVLIFLPPNVG